MADIIDKRAKVLANIRLIMLRALNEESNKSANDMLLQLELERFGYARSMEFIAFELRWLEKEHGAVRLTQAGSALIAELLQPGKDHLARRNALFGVQVPSSSLDS